MCAAYYIAYLPVMLEVVLKANSIILPDAAQFTVEWIYHSSAAANGFLYIALHSSVRGELRRYVPRCRRNTVAPVMIQPVGDGGNHLQHRGRGNVDAETPEAPATAMTSSCRRVTERLPTTEL